MKVVVIYKSKTGFTKQYAEWIAEELSADIFDVSNVATNIVAAYDIVIYGGSLYAVGINGVKYITKNLDILKDKKVIIFATGASPSSQEAIDEVRNTNFTPGEQKHIQFFYLRGGFNYSKLKPFDKVLMTLLKWKMQMKVKMKKDLTPDERGMLACYDKPVDFTRKKNIDKIITYVNS
ncbi:flavodoxin domain-containing protein [Clostridium sp. CM028]|uniref:flavodoxin domain-containing protein n=1 Tax=unclassified Clostridium TaxID=2614128 RepID=UPI001C0E1E42|nr:MULTISPECIES: flavodoxin domain-containing protein [unclassified Clostridium]MBU3092847.1 flavodoxin domain-containing protein [Clostridium sp. CF011]MBW9145845.1 flavodoxin domain-containing protein [Clostridium sp. CM027]MBW9149755.1 flavodoxin domain-containing protein [Clostridium sp. CM028]UVE42094.1 flavodoxin domain-containing protein [Clostridium sp. CM027]WAG71109.1 flavodoxin domain-containing protein [Clostridium sp. CF011]